jgi:hypothetical protein
MHKRNRLEAPPGDRDLLVALNKGERRDPMPWCSASVKCVGPAKAQLCRGITRCTHRQHEILRVGIRTELINAARMVNMDMCDKCTIEAFNVKSECLLTKIHPRIDHDRTSYPIDWIAPLNECCAPQAAVAHVAREADIATAANARNAAARSGSKDRETRCLPLSTAIARISCNSRACMVIGATDDSRWTATKRTVKCLIRKRVCTPILSARHMARLPTIQLAE